MSDTWPITHSLHSKRKCIFYLQLQCNAFISLHIFVHYFQLLASRVFRRVRVPDYRVRCACRRPPASPPVNARRVSVRRKTAPFAYPKGGMTPPGAAAAARRAISWAWSFHSDLRSWKSRYRWVTNATKTRNAANPTRIPFASTGNATARLFSPVDWTRFRAEGAKDPFYSAEAIGRPKVSIGSALIRSTANLDSVQKELFRYLIN